MIDSKQSGSLKKSWKYHFDRRDKAAVAGRHLPTVEELFAGMSFFRNDFRLDAQTWAERLLSTQIGKPQDPNGDEVLDALERITVSFTSENFADVETAMRYYGLGSQGPEYHINSVKRCILYRAMAGDASAIPVLCSEVSERLRKTFLDYEEGQANLSTLLGLIFMIRKKALGPEAPVDSMKVCYRNAVTYLENLFDRQTREDSKDDETVSLSKSLVQKPLTIGDYDENGLIVFSAIGNDHTHKDREFAFEPVRPFLNVSIPLRKVPPLAAIRSQLIFEYPYATEIVDRVLDDLVGRDRVAIRPTILVGAPGSGKTSFATRLCEALGIDFEIYNCSTTFDNSFAGTARRWSSTEPAFPANLILRTKISNPVIILDEIDKAGGSKHNGTFAESLLPMIEPSSAKNFHDNCLQAKINLTGLNWIATANDANLIPKPLRDRFQILRFPSPGRAHISSVANQIMTAICAEYAVDVRWYEKLSHSEIEALSEAWPGGSLRALKQLIRGVLLARDEFAARH